MIEPTHVVLSPMELTTTSSGSQLNLRPLHGGRMMRMLWSLRKMTEGNSPDPKREVHFLIAGNDPHAFGRIERCTLNRPIQSSDEGFRRIGI